jgi:hypothetical protein
VGGDLEIEVAQNLRAEPVTQSDIFEPNQAQLRSLGGTAGNPIPETQSSLGSLRLRAEQIGCASVMVSGSLTVAL